MFTRALCLALLTASLSSFTAQAAPARQQQQQSCDVASVKTVVQTVTVTARAAAPTNAGSNTQNQNAGGNQATPAKGGNNQSNTSNNQNNNGASNQGNTKGNNGSTKGGNTGASNAGAGNTASITTSAAAAGKTNAGNKGGNAGNTAGNTGNAGNAGNSTANNGGDAQTSLTLDPKVIAAGFANDGQDVPAAGQVKSLTSTNNFINFCLTVNLPLTDGKQVTGGSCNPAPIGAIPSTANMPSSKFVFPQNFATIQANKAFTISMAIQNLQTGFFVNAQENYFSAPQVLNAQGQIQGHSHVVVEQLSAIDQTTVTDPRKFAFFKGLNAAAANGQLTADVTSGLPAGFYKLSSINSAANHQPVIVAVAQHGSLDDAVYFSVTADGKPVAGAISATAAAPNAAAASAAAATDKNAPAASASVAAAATSAATKGATGKGAAAASAAAAAATSPAVKGAAGKGAAAATPSAAAGKAAPTAEKATATPAANSKAAPSSPADSKTKANVTNNSNKVGNVKGN